MCAIFGSNRRAMFDVLYEANRERGKYAFSCLFGRDDKKHNVYQYDKHPLMDNVKDNPAHNMFLGHCQAPTSALREYSKKTSHPFNFGDWFVAHNGVINNFKQLKSKYFSNNFNNPVDSSIIPAMLDDIEQTLTSVSEIKAIKTVLARLKGTFAVWIYNANSGNVFIARQGCPIFVNHNIIAFSSICGENFEEIPEGEIYRVSDLGITKVESFTHKSPFLVLKE